MKKDEDHPEVWLKKLTKEIRDKAIDDVLAVVEKFIGEYNELAWWQEVGNLKLLRTPIEALKEAT